MDKKEAGTPVALVTGANRGIGLAVVKGLAGRGFRVFLGARRPQAGEEAVRSLEVDAQTAGSLFLDVADAASIREAAAQFGRQAGRLDVLINNAGVLLDEEKSVLELSGETLLKTFLVNTIGPLRVAQAFWPLLKKSRRPRLINVSSRAGQLSSMGTYAPAYSVSKAALNAVTRQLSAAFPQAAVNSVCPGWVRTDMGGASAPRSVEEGADSILWLAAEAPQELTGQFIHDRQPIPW